MAETGIVLNAKRGPEAKDDFDELRDRMRLIIEPVTAEHARLARRALNRAQPLPPGARRPASRDRSIHDWLKTIRSRGGDSPVIVVINKSDEDKRDLRVDETGRRETYGNIIAFQRTSCDLVIERQKASGSSRTPGSARCGRGSVGGAEAHQDQ